jgi:SPP1 gp7 family putative phage head morphogenesis protein
MSEHSEFMRAANEQRLETFRANRNIIKGVRWLATLDRHCCVICGALDGASWDLDGNPLGDTTFQFHAPPLHPECRCVLSPVTKTFREIGLDIDEPTDTGQRASCEGPISGSTSFQDFLKRQSPEFVRGVLGEERAELFLSGKLALRDLVTPDCCKRAMPELHALIAGKP